MTADGNAVQASESIWSLLDRPLWVVTAATPTARGGLIATWITQSSLDPQTPQVLAGIAPNHFTAELIDQSGAVGFHLLRESQIDLVERFATKSGRHTDKLAGLELRPETEQENGPPILADCAAWMRCRVFARLEVGDRIFFWADVLAAANETEAGTVLRESHLGQLPNAVRDQLRADKAKDVDLQAPWATQWRETLPNYLKPLSDQ